MQAHHYPRPQLERSNWINLNGTWRFALDSRAEIQSPSQVEWNDQITVPFAPETEASGVSASGLFKACWYQREFDAPELAGGERLVLHFGAVDWHATVWVNGNQAVVHDGGYTPFSADITDFLVATGPQVIELRAEDDPLDLEKPRGKQDWKLEPHSIWYQRTTGIWQTVWLEKIPQHSIRSLKWQANVENWELRLDARLQHTSAEPLLLSVILKHKNEVLTRDTYEVSGTSVSRRICLPDPGIDSGRAELMWTPERPNLIYAELILRDHRGNVLDQVNSYTAMRSIAVDEDRFLLNGRPYRLRMALDQGYWEKTGLTAPDDAALRLDIELAKLMKFNGVRKHQKIEDPRFLYWADFLGLLVWEEMPSAYTFSPRAIERSTRTWLEALERDMSHPCIVTWVPFNESWGVPDLPLQQDQRDYVRSLYHLTKAMDKTRPVVGNDGWEICSTDIIAVHDYDKDPSEISRRFDKVDGSLEQLYRHERPGGRVILLDELQRKQPIMLTEFGGILFSDKADTWGYSKAETVEQFGAQYKALVESVRAIPVLSGFCYTQLTDTYQEANGLLYMDRTPKLPVELVAAANTANQNLIEHFADTYETIDEMKPYVSGPYCERVEPAETVVSAR